MKRSAFLLALCGVSVALTVSSAWADTLTYYPNGETAEAPYLWSTAANWATSAKTPTLLDPPRVPEVGDAVDLTANELSASPLVINEGDSITVAALNLALGDANNLPNTSHYGNGAGTWLQMKGGELSVSGNFAAATKNYQWFRFDLLGGVLSVGGSLNLGSANAYATTPSVMTVAKGALVNVAGTLQVGVRTQRGLTCLTNRGEIVTKNLIVGGNSTSYGLSGGEMYSEGKISLSGALTVAGSSKAATASGLTNTLVLAKGSSLTYTGTGPKSLAIASGPGTTGILDASVDINAGDATVTIGNSATGKGFLRIRDEATFTANSVRVAAVQNGGYGKVELFDDAKMDVGTVYASDIANVDACVTLNDRSVLRNVKLLCLGTPSGSRLQSRGYLLLNDSASVVFDPDESGRLFGGGQSNGWMSVMLNGSSTIRNVKQFQVACGKSGQSSASDFTRGGELKLTGGCVEFLPTEDSTELQLGVSGSLEQMTPTVTVSGFGTITRTDIADPDAELRVNLIASCPIWSITADGQGTARTLDLRAISEANGSASTFNKSGTNGWYAVNKGKLVYPRAYPVGWDSKNAVRAIGDFPKLGNNGVPKYVNSFTVKFPEDQGDAFGYLYAEQYATDREDIPAGLPVGTPEDKLAIVKLGVNSADGGWTADDPSSPIDFGSVTVNYCYPTNAIREATSKVVVYHHPGTAGGHWTRVARATSKDAGTVTVSSLRPVEGAAWNVGWLAVVAEEKSGMMLIFR